MTFHECTVYCRNGNHASLLQMRRDEPMDSVLTFITTLLGQHGMELVHAELAPGDGLMEADIGWDYDASGQLIEVGIPVDRTDYVQYLMVWRPSLASLQAYRDRLRIQMEEVWDAMDRGGREAGALPGEGQPHG